MVTAVRVVPIDFDLLPRNRYVFVILAPHGPPLTILILDQSRITVRHVAARLVGFVRHEPSRIELFMQRNVVGGMVTLLRDGLPPPHDERIDGYADDGGEKCYGQSTGEVPHVQPSMLQSEFADNTRQ